MEIDTEKLRKAIRDFEFYSRPSSATHGTPATVDDVNRVIGKVADVLNTFVQELEKND